MAVGVIYTQRCTLMYVAMPRHTGIKYMYNWSYKFKIRFVANSSSTHTHKHQMFACKRSLIAIYVTVYRIHTLATM